MLTRNTEPVRKQIKTAAAFAALGDRTRLSLVSRLSGGDSLSIAELTTGSRLSRQAITKHLRVLEHAGLVHATRDGRESLFTLEAARLRELTHYLEHVGRQWKDALARLKSFVEK